MPKRGFGNKAFTNDYYDRTVTNVYRRVVYRTVKGLNVQNHELILDSSVSREEITLKDKKEPIEGAPTIMTSLRFETHQGFIVRQ